MDEGIFSFFLDNFGIKTVIFIMATYALFLLITNLPKIIDSMNYFQSRKIKHITEALTSEWVDDNYKKILKKDISRLYLSGTLKIKANEKQVKEIIKISDIMQGSCNAKEIYSVIINLPYEFYNLGINTLEKEKKRQERKMDYEKIMFYLFVLVVPSFYIVYLYSYAKGNNYYLEWKLKNLMLIFIPMMLVSVNTMSFVMFKKKNKNIIKVLNVVISYKEEN